MTKSEADLIGIIRVTKDDLKEAAEAEGKMIIVVESTGSTDPFETVGVSSPDMEEEADNLKTLQISQEVVEEDSIITIRESSDTPL